MTATDVDVGEEAIRMLAGQVFDAPKDHTKAKETNGVDVDAKGTGKKKYQKQQGQSEDGKEKEKRPVYAQKYHDDNLLAEAVIVGRKPCFAVAAPTMGDPQQVSITLQDSIPIDDKTVLKTFEIAVYVNEPYVFKSQQEFAEFVKKTKDENLDSLYGKVKSIWKNT